MQRFNINYFGEREVGYFGTLDGAIAYAERHIRTLISSHRGEIVISTDKGIPVATQTWTKNPDGSSSPSDWECDSVAFFL